MAEPGQALVKSEGGPFVFFPNRHAHDSWRADILAAPLWDLLAGCPRTEGRLAAFVTERAALGAPAPPRFDTPQAKFCLLPAPVLLKLAQRIGVTLNATRLGKVIEGKLVARIKRELGPETYDFALRRAPLITTATDPLAPDLAAEAPLGDLLERSGINVMGLALADLDAGLKSRFKLKLPKPHAELIATPQGGVRPDAAWRVVRKVVRETEPEWSGSLE